MSFPHAKKHIVSLFLCLAVFGALAAPIGAYATGNRGETQPGYTPRTSPTSAAQNQLIAKGPEQDKPDTKSCYTTNWGIPWVNLDGCVAFAMNLVMWLAARSLYIAGVVFNISVERTLNMSTLLADLPIVEVGWKILRDISNIVFIFIALWSGISITLGIKAEQAWGYLAQMVLVALFINFSLFITQTVVDASSIAALHFYNLITPPENRLDYDAGLSEAFMQGLRLQTLYDPNNLGTGNTASGIPDLIGGGVNMTNTILAGFFGSILIVVAAFVFFAAAILFIIRGVTLVLLMVLSPLAFIAWIVPGASGLGSSWWSKLWSQSFFAPLYLALAYVVVSVINSGAFQGTLVKATSGGTGPTFAAAFTGNTATPILLIFNFIILIGLLVGCLIVAQSLGARGSDTLISWGGKLRGEATGLVGRSLVRGIHVSEDSWLVKRGQAMLDKDKSSRTGAFLKSLGGKEIGSIRKLNEIWSNSKFGQTSFGKTLREQTTGRLSEAKFGGSKTAEEAYEEHETMVSRRRDIEWGKISKDNALALRPLRKEEFERQEKKFKMEEALNNAEKAYDEAKQANAPETDLAEKRGAVVQARANLDRATSDLNNWNTQNAAQIRKMVTAISTAMAKMTTEGFLHQQKSFFLNPEVMDVSVLGADKFSALMKSEHFTNREKEEYTEARLKRMEQVAHRGEDRATWYNEAWPRYQRALEAFEKKVKEEIDPESRSNDGTSLSDIQRAFEEAQKELQQELAKDKGERDVNKVDSLTQTLNGLGTKMFEANRSKEELVKQKVDSGELEVPEMPEQSGWGDADDIRKAMRNMRSTEEVINWYRHGRHILDYELVQQTLMQGLLDKIRESPEVDSQFKEQWRVGKRGYVRDAGWAVAGFDAAKMEKMHAVIGPIVEDFMQTISKQMQKVGETEYFDNFDKKTIEKDGEKYSAAELLKKVVDAYNAKAPGADLKDDVSIEERKLRNRAGYAQYDQVSQNLANNEFTKMPGILRNLYVVLRKLDEATIAPYGERDLDQKIPMVEFLLNEYVRDIQQKGRMSDENAQIFTYFVNKGGTQFIPFGNLQGKYKKAMQLIAAVIGRDDPRSLATFAHKGNSWEAPRVMSEYNAIRAEVGLPPLPPTADTNLEERGIRAQQRKG